MIRVQREDFDVGRELERLSAGDHTVGGVASFIGLVRDFNLQGGSSASSAERVSAMTLEHYPGMTERKLAEIEAEANRRWPLAASLIIHRAGAEKVSPPGQGPACRGALGRRPAGGLMSPQPTLRPAASPGSD